MPEREPSPLARAMRVAAMTPGSPLLSLAHEPASNANRGRIRRLPSLCVRIKGLTVGQFPNAPLGLWLLASIGARFASGDARIALETLAIASLGVWALMEVTSGSNWFRRTAGLVVLAFVIARLAEGLAATVDQ